MQAVGFRFINFRRFSYVARMDSDYVRRYVSVCMMIKNWCVILCTVAVCTVGMQQRIRSMENRIHLSSFSLKNVFLDDFYAIYQCSMCCVSKLMLLWLDNILNDRLDQLFNEQDFHNCLLSKMSYCSQWCIYIWRMWCREEMLCRNVADCWGLAIGNLQTSSILK